MVLSPKETISLLFIIVSVACFLYYVQNPKRASLLSYSLQNLKKILTLK